MVLDRAERIVYHALKRLGPGQAIPGYGIHKLLYRLKQDHPERFAADLPFYWYEHGPYSEPIKEATTALALAGRLQEDPVPGGWQYSIRTDDSPGELSPDELAAIESTLATFGKMPARRIMSDIYWQDAPYAFMPVMKLELLPTLQIVAEDFSASSGRPGWRAEEAIKKVPGALAKCEGRLPPEPYFDEFVAAFSIYRAAADRALAFLQRSPGPDAAALATRVSHKSWEVWATFARGARVLHHDAYYDVRKNEWDAQFRREASALHREMDQFYDDATNAILPTLRPANWTPVDKAIVSAAFRDETV